MAQVLNPWLPKAELWPVALEASVDRQVAGTDRNL